MTAPRYEQAHTTVTLTLTKLGELAIRANDGSRGGGAFKLSQQEAKVLGTALLEFASPATVTPDFNLFGIDKGYVEGCPPTEGYVPITNGGPQEAKLTVLEAATILLQSVRSLDREKANLDLLGHTNQNLDRDAAIRTIESWMPKR